jgi:hypothetical protein
MELDTFVSGDEWADLNCPGAPSQSALSIEVGFDESRILIL